MAVDARGVRRSPAIQGSRCFPVVPALGLLGILAIAGTIVAVTTTTVIGYNNIKKDLGQIDDQVKGIRDDFKEVAEENKKAIETLEITDEALTRELEELKKRVEVLEEKVQEK